MGLSKDFAVEAIDLEDGSRCELASFDRCSEAVEFLNRYVSRENAGGWDRIEVVDLRGEIGDTLMVWEREDTNV